MQRHNFSIINKIRKKYHYDRYFKVSGLLKDGNLLDIGCGRAASFMHDNAFICYTGRGIGLDIKPCEDSLCIQGDICLAPFKNRCFDNIVAMEVLEHVFDLDTTLSEIKRIAKKDSHIVISTPINSYISRIVWFIAKNSFSREWKDKHINNFNFAGWKRKLENYFIIKRIYIHWHLDLIFELRTK